MKQFLIILIAAVCVFSASSCKKDKTYPQMPKRVFMASRVALGATTYTNRVTARKTVASAVVRVYVNRLVDTDVTANFNVSGTAVEGVNYQPLAARLIVIPAGSYYGEMNLDIINDPAQTQSRTIIFTLTTASNGFEPGVGTDYAFKDFIYTINP